jgi:hypothetical protein
LKFFISKANHSNFSIVDSHTNLQEKARKNDTNQHHESKYLHRKRRKYIRKSNRFSRSQRSAHLRTLSILSIVIQNQPLSSVDNQSKLLVEENEFKV